MSKSHMSYIYATCFKIILSAEKNKTPTTYIAF